MKNKHKNTRENTPMADYINSRMAMMEVKKNSNRKALSMYRQGFVPTNRLELLTDEERSEYAKRIKRLLGVLNCLALRFSMYADGLKEMFYDIKGSEASIENMVSAVKDAEVKFIDTQMAIGNLWKALEPFHQETEGEITVRNDNILEELMKVCFSTDRDGRETSTDQVVVRMPKTLYETMCAANPKFRTLYTFGGGIDL